jgi:hypothetical protein
VLFLAADDLHVVKWYVDASFAVHKDFRSHTGGAMTYGTGVPITRAINIRYFFVTDQIEKKNLEIKYLPTKLMIGDFFTKPLQGQQFTYFRNLILGKVSVSSTDIDERSVLEGVPLSSEDEGQTSRSMAAKQQHLSICS